MLLEIPVSIGELIDKITILEIKAERIADPDKQANVARELDLLRQKAAPLAASEPALPSIQHALKEVNGELWEIEDRIRDKERAKAFDDEFVKLARSVYVTNDKRAALKRQINGLFGSALVEEKSYKPY